MAQLLSREKFKNAINGSHVRCEGTVNHHYFLNHRQPAIQRSKYVSKACALLLLISSSASFKPQEIISNRHMNLVCGSQPRYQYSTQFFASTLENAWCIRSQRNRRHDTVHQHNPLQGLYSLSHFSLNRLTAPESRSSRSIWPDMR